MEYMNKLMEETHFYNRLFLCWREEMIEAIKEQDLKDAKKPFWKTIDFECCVVCGDELQGHTKLENDGYFYDEDPVRCVGDCQKVVGHMSCDGESAYVSYDDE
jgi:hypothetical protein